ncbi:MAG: hypothetical protein GXY44_15440 [Phycisphaerales bacterium]|nr:hypothetical protein [Phycisphaerales bacterium]
MNRECSIAGLIILQNLHGDLDAMVQFAIEQVLSEFTGPANTHELSVDGGAAEDKKIPGRNETDKGGIVYLCGVRPGVLT